MTLQERFNAEVVAAAMIEPSIVRVPEEAEPIAHNNIDDVYIFYTPSGRLVQSATYDEAKAKWLLTKETD